MVICSGNRRYCVCYDFTLLCLKMKKQIIFCLLLSFVFCLETNAQCAMCRAVLETSEGHTVAEGINDGIVYLMAVPYILMAGIGYFIYKKYNTLKK